MIENDWAHFGLRYSPFEHNSETGFYFPIKDWEQRIELLLHLCQFSQAILVMTGQIGSGKSTFKNRFIACAKQADPNKKHIVVCHLIGSMLFTPSHLYEALQTTFGLTASHSEDPCAQLFEQVRESGKRYLIVVDDAHLLPQDTLSLLLKMGSKGFDVAQGLHVLLIGRSILSSHLAKVPMTENADHLLHTTVLEPFTLMETKQYIAACFHQAGFKGRLPIPDPEIAKIYRDSKGCPQDINQLTEKWLATVSGQRQILSFSFKGLLSKGRLTAVLLILVGGLWLSQSAHFSSKLSSKPSSKPSSKQVVSVPIKPNITHKTPSKTPPLQTITLESITNDKTTMQTNTTPKVPIATPTTPPPVKAASAAAQPAKQKMNPKEADAILAGINQDGDLHIDLSDTKKPMETPPVTQQSPPTKNTSVPNIKPVSTQLTAPTLVAPIPRAKPATSTSVVFLHPKTKSTIAKPRSKRPVSLSQMALIAHQHAVSRLPASHYTLQLVGVHTIADAVHFMQKHTLSTARFVPVKSNNQLFYVVLLGNFDSAAAAKTALSTLPVAIKQLHPWIRSFHSIQKAMPAPMPLPNHAQVTHNVF